MIIQIKKPLLFILTALLLITCNKNQKATNQLDGEWVMDRLIIEREGINIDVVEFGRRVEYSFEACKLKNVETCALITETTEFGTTEATVSEFRVLNDGLNLQIIDNDTSESLFEINTLDAEVLVLINMNDTDSIKRAIMTKKNP